MTSRMQACPISAGSHARLAFEWGFGGSLGARIWLRGSTMLRWSPIAQPFARSSRTCSGLGSATLMSKIVRVKRYGAPWKATLDCSQELHSGLGSWASRGMSRSTHGAREHVPGAATRAATTTRSHSIKSKQSNPTRTSKRCRPSVRYACNKRLACYPQRNARHCRCMLKGSVIARSRASSTYPSVLCAPGSHAVARHWHGRWARRNQLSRT